MKINKCNLNISFKLAGWLCGLVALFACTSIYAQPTYYTVSISVDGYLTTAEVEVDANGNVTGPTETQALGSLNGGSNFDDMGANVGNANAVGVDFMASIPNLMGGAQAIIGTDTGAKVMGDQLVINGQPYGLHPAPDSDLMSVFSVATSLVAVLKWKGHRRQKSA